MAQILVPSQYSTIQAAVTASTSGDEIVVSAGTYNETLTITSKNGLLIRAATGEVVTITNTGVLVTFPATCHHITFQGITFTKTGSAASVMVASSTSAAICNKFIDCTFDISAWSGAVILSPLIFLYPGDANAPSMVRRCRFIGNNAESFQKVVEWATAGAANQTILCESNFVYQFIAANSSGSALFYLNGGSSAGGNYVARNNTFLSCKTWRAHIWLIGAIGGALASCYNNVFQSSAFWSAGAAQSIFHISSGLTTYCAYNTGDPTVVNSNLARPDTTANTFVLPLLDSTTGIPTSASPIYRSGITLSGQGETRMWLSQSRVPFASSPSRGAFEVYATGKAMLHLKYKYIAPMNGMGFNMTGQAAPTLPTTLRSFNSPMEVAEYVERAIQPTKGLEYGPIEFWYDFENYRYRAACYLSTFVLTCSAASPAAALFGTQSLTGQTDTG